MESIPYLDILVVFLGSVLGSIKASVEFDKDKGCLPRSLDISIGMFCGCTLTFHFGNELSIGLSGLIALVGGASGAVVIEVILQMLPSIAKKFIRNWVENKIKSP